MIHAIICENDLSTIVNRIEEILDTKKNIKGIKLVDNTDNQVVLLLSEDPIDQKTADIWWSGYSAFLGAQ